MEDDLFAFEGSLEPVDIEKTIDELVRNDRISNFSMDKSINPERKDSIWYGGELIKFTVDNRYEFRFEAVGDLRVVMVAPDGGYEFLVDKNNSGYVGRELLSYGITCDDDILFAGFEFYNKENAKRYFEENPDKKCILFFEDGNWFNLSIYDSKKDIMHDYLDNFGDILDVIAFCNIESIDETIKYVNCY